MKSNKKPKDISIRAVDAVLYSNFDKLLECQAAGVDLATYTNSDGWNMLHYALISPTLPIDPEMITYLIEQGVPINGIDGYGYTPLHYAARGRRKAVIKLLIDAGAAVHMKNNDGNLALHIAMGQGTPDPELFELFLKSAPMEEEDAKMLLAGTKRMYYDEETAAALAVFQKYLKK